MKSIKKIKGGAFIESFDVKTNCIIRKYSDYVVNDDTKVYTIGTNLVVNSEVNDKSIGISFYVNDKNVIFNLNRFDYGKYAKHNDTDTDDPNKKFPYSTKAKTLIQKLNEFKPTKIILFGLTDIIIENFLVLLKPCILYQNQTICLYILTNYNDEILIGADKGNIIAIKDANRLNLRHIDVDSILKNSQFSGEDYDVVNVTGFYTESPKILVDHGFATGIGICATVDNKNYMAHLYPHTYTYIDNPTIKSWIKLINDKNITKLIIFGQDKSILINFSDKLQQLLQPLDINLYVLRDYNAWNITTFIGINKNELIMFKNKFHLHINEIY